MVAWPKVKIVKTVAQVAAHFNVSERWVANWLVRGAPGRRGCYDLAAIAKWREANRVKAIPGEGSAHERWMEARAQKEMLKVAQMQRELIPLDAARRIIVRHIAEANALREQLPDRVLAILPRGLGKGIRAQVRTAIKRLLDAAHQALADSLLEPPIAKIGEA